MEVELGGGVIRCTGNHPFYVRGRGFIPAEQLKCGDELRTASGGWSSVGVITASGLEEPVYNIRVAGLHTYFVRAGASEALVHNKGGDPNAGALTISGGNASNYNTIPPAPPELLAAAAEFNAHPPAPVASPPGPALVVANAKLSPKERLKAQIRAIIRQTSTFSAADELAFAKGVAEGFGAGIQNTWESIKSLPQTAKAAAMVPVRWLDGLGTFYGDLLGSLYYGTTPVQANAISASVDAVRERLTAGAVAMAQFSSLFAVALGPQVLLPPELIPKAVGDLQEDLANEIIDEAGPLAISLMSAAADLSPEQKGYIVGLVMEQVAEVGATAGAGAASRARG